jgi:hypothetical protein
MELPLPELLILVSSIFGMAACTLFIRHRSGNSELNTKIKNRYNSYIADIEAENKKLKGAVNRSKQPIRISEEVANDDNPLGAVSEVIDLIAPRLPPGVRSLLKSKKAVDFITNYAQQNPDAVKSIMSKFTQTKGDNAKESEIGDTL